MVDIIPNSQEVIGHGAFSLVYSARLKQRPNQVVAIKAITKKNLAKSQNLLGKEIKILKELTELHHENVVALLDCKETTNHVYLVMEYCNGGDLADYLNAKGTLSEDTIRSFLRQLSGAMQAMVSKNIVHRDLKPQNILLSHDGRSKNPLPQDIKLKIADFGFARFLQDGVMAATLCGSPMYMAPEVIMSLQYDSKADLWSLGTIVFQCLTGKAPFQAQTPQALKHFYEKNAQLIPRIPSSTSPELRDLLLKLLKRNAVDRIDFETFFHHPFIRPKKKSKPVNVPPTSSSGTNTPMNSVPPSPVVNIINSPPKCSVATNVMVGGASATPPIAANPTGKRDLDYSSDTGNSPSDQDDFVIVPTNLTMDSADQQKRNRTANPNGSGKQRRHTVGSRPPAVLNPVLAAAQTPQTEPIPVPTQKAAYQQIQQSLVRSRSRSGDSVSAMSGVSSASGGSTLGPLPEDGIAPSPSLNRKSQRSSSVSSPLNSPKSPTKELVSASAPLKTKSRRVSGPPMPDICQMSPPPVQFTMGTPPMGHRRRTSSGSSCGGASTPPPSVPWQISPNLLNPITPTTSPIRKSSAPVGLPPILGSPEGSATAHGHNDQNNWIYDATQPTRAMTVPENLSRQVSIGAAGASGGSSGDNPINLRRRSAEVQLAAGGRNVVLNYGHQAIQPFNRSNSLINLARRSSFNSNKENTSPVSMTLAGGNADFFPDGFPLLPPPELSEETLLAPEHTEILNKLRFISVLTDTIIDVARGKAAPLSALTESITPRLNASVLDSNLPQHRRLQQLLLYMRCLQLLSQTLEFARTELKSKKLKPSASVKNVLSTLNERFRHCLSMTRMLNSENLLSECGLDSGSSEITADRLLYSHAVEQCQSAALDELFGNPEECFRRYQGAHILLHALQFQTQNDEEKNTLTKYKEAVEKRLHILEDQGYIQSYESAI